MSTQAHQLMWFPPALRAEMESNIRKQNKNQEKASLAKTPGDYLTLSFRWSDTTQGDYYWRSIYVAMHMLDSRNPPSSLLELSQEEANKIIERHNLKYTLCAFGTVPEAQTTKKQDKDMSNKYSNLPVAKVTMVYGTDVSTLDAETCLALIKGNNEKAKALRESGVTGPYIEQQLAGLTAANGELVTQLNTFAAPAAATPAE